MTLQAIFLLPTLENCQKPSGPRCRGGPTLGTRTIYFFLFDKLEFLAFYQISLFEISQCRSDLLTNRNDNIIDLPNML